MSNTYKDMLNGSVTCRVKCLLEKCEDWFQVTFKSYKSAYRPKKKSATVSHQPPKWYIHRFTNLPYVEKLSACETGWIIQQNKH